jgi:predicted AlkP superfamily pyrophosphatase or phosphodiesterase
MVGRLIRRKWFMRSWVMAPVLAGLAPSAVYGQAKKEQAIPAATPKPAAVRAEKPMRPKLVVLIVVDQMRADYVDKFRGQWTGGLKRLIEEGAWFREAAYPYAATETCVGHATISTGAFPSTHGMIANAWWDRDTQKMVTCTADSKATNSGYAGATVKGGDSAWRMEVPSFAEELKFQSGGTTRVVSFSLKARASITMAGHKGDAVAWIDARSGALVTSNVYGKPDSIDDFMKAHPVKNDYGKTWSLSLPRSEYLYDEKATGAVPPAGWDLTFPHPLRGKEGGSEPDAAFGNQWAASPFADTYLTQLAETAVDTMDLGKGSGTDFLAVGYSSVDVVGHAFGPRSWEIQDLLVRLDKDLGDLFAHLDAKVGRGNYVVALSADHGVVPVPEDMQSMGVDSGVLSVPELQENMEKALEPFNLGRPAVARIAGSDVYFAPDVYEALKDNPDAMQAVLDAAKAQPGVAEVYVAEEVADRQATQNPVKRAFEDGYFAGRSGDMLIVAKPYWLMDDTEAGKKRNYGTGHGTPYGYDQRVPVLLMGYGIQPGEYFGNVTPADIAPTLAALCGITLAPRDGRVLREALKRSSEQQATAKPMASAGAKAPKP